jgi:hypothetical protein
MILQTVTDPRRVNCHLYASRLSCSAGPMPESLSSLGLSIVPADSTTSWRADAICSELFSVALLAVSRRHGPYLLSLGAQGLHILHADQERARAMRCTASVTCSGLVPKFKRTKPAPSWP